MTTGINFWDGQVWAFVVTMFYLFAAMILANTLRNTIRPLRRLMIPSSVLGGLLLLLVSFVYKECSGRSLIPTETLEMLTYHGLGLGFVAMALRNIEKAQDKRSRSGAFDAGVTVVSGYLLQAVAGLLISMLCCYLLHSFWASGLLLPMGYGQGPGQAYNWGHNYEALYGFEGGTSFGLTVAAMGFLSASVGGVIYLNKLRRRGILGKSSGFVDNDVTAEQLGGKNEIPLAESMDKFTVQLALVFIAYIAAYIFMKGVDLVIEAGLLGNFGFNTVRPLIWGFNFLFGTLFAILEKALLRGLHKKGVIKREYTNVFMQSRIAGFMFDLMVVASIAAIDLSAFSKSEFIVPLSIICVAGAAVTYAYLSFLCPRVFPNYSHEAFLSLYGMQTGTASTGVILLREMDPNFETQASDNIVYHQPWAIVFGFPMLLLLPVAAQSLVKGWVTLGILIVLFVVMQLIVFRKSIFKGKKKKA
jgi:ESS family glutamate:Na+ symporter